MYNIKRVRGVHSPIMGKIELTNIIIDDFSIAKRETHKTYTHILTHIHTDHLKGLTDGWNYGPIYCSALTKRMLLQKFPSLTCVNALPLETPTVLKMSASLQITITFFNANHCFGAVLVLLEGYLGNILYTGDIRYDRDVFQKYELIYPPELRNEQFVGCSKQIDLLYVDNTFLKKKFDFPKRQQVLGMTLSFVKELIELNQHTRIYIAMDTYGKEEVLQYLAKQLDVYIVVDELKYQILRAMERDLQLYTTNVDQGFIQVISKRKVGQSLNKDPHSICLVLSGWANHPTYRHNNRVYCLPYSLHSNFREIHQFVNSIRPSYIEPIVFSYPQEDRIFYADREFNKKLLVFQQESIRYGQQDYIQEMEQLRKLYCSAPREEYRMLMGDTQLQRELLQRLLPPKMLQFSQEEKQMMPVHFQTVQRKKYKLKSERNEAEINRLRNQILLKKKLIQGVRVHVIDDQEIVIDEESPHFVPPLPKHDFSIDDPQEMDPFHNPNRNSKGRRSTFFNNKPQFSEGRQAEQRQMEKIKRTLKEEPVSSSHRDLKENRMGRMNQARLEEREKEEIAEWSKKAREPSQTARISSIDLDEIGKLRVLRSDRDIQRLFHNNGSSIAFIQHFFNKKHQKSS